MAGDVAIHIHHLRRAYGPKVVLDQTELLLQQGLHFMVGPNGAGKTTLFKCLAGLIPYEGRVTLLGSIDPHRHRMKHRRVVALCPAEPLFPEYLRGEELLQFSLRARGLPTHTADAVLEALGMRHFLGAKTGTYSSGMKKKLGLAMALAGSLPITLLDEPYSALDQPSRRALAGLIQDGLSKGRTFLIASHLADLHAAFGQGHTHLLENGCFRSLAPGEHLPWMEPEGLMEEGG